MTDCVVKITVREPATVSVRETEIVKVRAQTTMPGPPGPPGPPNVGVQFPQPVAATPWVINHNLGRNVDVEVFTVGGMRMLADVQHVSPNQAQVLFTTPTTGYAFVH